MVNKQPLSISEMLESVADGLDQQIESIFSYKPSPKQKTFHCSTLEEKMLMGGNRSGKTVSNVVECVWRLTKTHPFRPELNEIRGPIRGRLVCVSYTEGIEKIILPLLKKWIPAQYLIGRSWDKSWKASVRTLTLSNGSFIELMSYDQQLEKFAGTSRHFVSFDEEPPKSIWSECLLRLVDTDGDWWISMTPVEGLTWTWSVLYKPWEEKKRPATLIVKMSIYDNPTLSAKAIAKILENITDPDERKAREFGEYVFIKGLVYKDFDPHIHNRGDGYQLVPGSLIYTSLDTGWRHPAAWLWHAVEPGGHITTFHEMVASENTVETWAREVLEWEAANIIAKGFSVYVRTGDPAMLQTKEHQGTSIIGEYAKHGIYIGVEGVPKGPGSVDIGVTKLTQYMQTSVRGKTLWGYSDCPILEEQIRNLRWENYETKAMDDKKPLKTTIEKKNDDAPDSLRYFITLVDDLTPQKLTTIQRYNNLIPSASEYYDGYAPRVNNDYVVYQGSIVASLEG